MTTLERRARYLLLTLPTLAAVLYLAASWVIGGAS